MSNIEEFINMKCIEDLKRFIPDAETYLLCKNNRYLGDLEVRCGLYHNYSLIAGSSMLPVFSEESTILIPTKKYYPEIIQKFIIWKKYLPWINY